MRRVYVPYKIDGFHEKFRKPSGNHRQCFQSCRVLTHFQCVMYMLMSEIQCSLQDVQMCITLLKTPLQDEDVLSRDCMHCFSLWICAPCQVGHPALTYLHAAPSPWFEPSSSETLSIMNSRCCFLMNFDCVGRNRNIAPEHSSSEII